GPEDQGGDAQDPDVRAQVAERDQRASGGDGVVARDEDRPHPEAQGGVGAECATTSVTGSSAGLPSTGGRSCATWPPICSDTSGSRPRCPRRGSSARTRRG